MIFKGVRDGRPYPDHGLSHRQWAQIPPRQIRLDELVTTTTVLALDRLLSEDSTFYGDLFPHAVRWKGIVYLEDGLHRALRAALQQRHVLHARVHLDMPRAARLAVVAPGRPGQQDDSAQHLPRQDRVHGHPSWSEPEDWITS
jgi:Arc/MetJ family transcription regulator